MTPRIPIDAKMRFLEVEWEYERSRRFCKFVINQKSFTLVVDDKLNIISAGIEYLL